MSFQPRSGMDSGTPQPSLRAGAEGEFDINELISCEFNIGTACVELHYSGSGCMNIYCHGVEDRFDTTLPMRTEMDRLIYNTPLEYARMVLDGTSEKYIRGSYGTHGLKS